VDVLKILVITVKEEADADQQWALQPTGEYHRIYLLHMVAQFLSASV
jgi:hypothetical protein